VDLDGTLIGDGVTVDIAGMIVEDIRNQGKVYNEILNLVQNSSGETITHIEDRGDGTFAYINEEGDEVTFDANTTRFKDTGDGTYILINANGDSLTITPVEGVIENIQNQGDIYKEILHLIQNNVDETI